MMNATPSATVSIESIPLAVALVGPDGHVTAANEHLVEVVGNDPTGRLLVDLVVGTNRVDLGDLLMRPDDHGRVDVRLRSRPSMHALLRLTPATDGQRLAFLEATADDNPLDAIATRALEVLGQGIVIGDGKRILSATSSAADLFGRSVDELLEIGSLFSLFEPSEQRRFNSIADDCARTGEPMPEHFRTALVHPDGEVLPVDLWIKATVRAGHTRTYTVIADARERALLDAELARKATHDPLTGLPNRYLLIDRLETLLRRFERSTSDDAEAALYYIDLDDFKVVNDNFGHIAGDHVLRVIAERVLETIRATDTAARIGGDEFVVVSEPDTHHEHDRLRRRLCAALSQPIVHDDVEFRTGASIGMCRFSDGTVDVDSILARADRDMYDAKAARRAY